MKKNRFSSPLLFFVSLFPSPLLTLQQLRRKVDAHREQVLFNKGTSQLESLVQEINSSEDVSLFVRLFFFFSSPPASQLLFFPLPLFASILLLLFLLQTYLRDSGLLGVFPSLSARLEPNSKFRPRPFPLKREYFSQTTIFNQVYSLCQQLRSDIALSNHKYISHQIALLYVSQYTLLPHSFPLSFLTHHARLLLVLLPLALPLFLFLLISSSSSAMHERS
jgi:hypothetical protein